MRKSRKIWRIQGENIFQFINKNKSLYGNIAKQGLTGGMPPHLS
jgi:hypothetical protein